MNPLKVALIVKPSTSILREGRNMGWWSYDVPEFVWTHFQPVDDVVDGRKFDGYDLIFQEDSGPLEYRNRRVPLVYHAIDSTLSDGHYQIRRRRARQADLTLVDHDELRRFPGSRRWAYCVNDRVFQPLSPRTVDVSMHCGHGASKGAPGGVERDELRHYLAELAVRMGFTYRSKALPLGEYAESMGRSKVIVNLPRTMANRPHRVFDAMACGACLVTGRLPAVDGDYREAGVHYIEFDEAGELPALLERLLAGGWEPIAEAGYRLVMERHTWAVRAKELREMLAKELGL